MTPPYWVSNINQKGHTESPPVSTSRLTSDFSQYGFSLGDKEINGIPTLGQMFKTYGLMKLLFLFTIKQK